LLLGLLFLLEQGFLVCLVSSCLAGFLGQRLEFLGDICELLDHLFVFLDLQLLLVLDLPLLSIVIVSMSRPSCLL
jgi:hypothetical protein